MASGSGTDAAELNVRWRLDTLLTFHCRTYFASLLLSSLLLAPALAQNPSPHQQPSLEDRKLELEIAKLENEVSSTDIGQLVQVGTLAIALLAAIVSFWSAWNSQRAQSQSLNQQVEHQKHERISGLLKELGSESKGVRVAAIQALSDDPSTHRFIVNLLKYEGDPYIVDAAVAALQKAPEHSIPLLIASTNGLRNRMLLIGCQLVSSGMEKDDVAGLLQIENSVLKKWIDSTRGKRAIAHYTATAEYQAAMQTNLTNTSQSNVSKDLLRQWHELTIAFNHTIHAIESVIQAATSGDPLRIVSGYLKGVILDGFELDGWSFIDCDLRDASFRQCSCTGANFSNSLLSSASFNAARLHDTVFDGAELKGASFVCATLKRASFSDCNAYDASFIKAKAKGAKFTRAKLTKGNFFKFIGTDCDFSDSAFLGASLMESILNESTFINTDLSGAKLNKSALRRSAILQSKIAGTDLTEADFRGSNIQRTNFIAVRLFKGSRFAGIESVDNQFDGVSTAFREHFMASMQKSYSYDPSPKTTI